MSCATRCAVLTLALSLLGACASAPDPETQTLIQSIADANQDVVRLSVHAVPAGETDLKAVASTSSEKLGKPSDPEDIKAVQTGETVVLDEKDGIDVTIPILMKDGKHTAAAGVTVNSALGREAAMTLARSIASQVETGMSDASMPK